MRFLNLRHIALIACLAMLPGTGFGAPSARIQVSATLLPFLSFQATQHVTSYHVSGEDLARGYLDLPDTLTVTIKTNLEGVPFRVDGTEGATVLIRESGSPKPPASYYTLTTAGYRAGTPISKRLDARILLAPNANLGVHTLTISVTPAT